MDFVTGLVVLLFVLLLYLLLWNSIAVRWGLVSKQTAIEASAIFASESLLTTPGEPESWEMLPHIDGNVSAIGLVNGRNELNRMKLDKLVAENATNYYAIKSRLGLQRYDVGMRISDIAGNTIYYEFGKFGADSMNNSLNFDRLGMLDGRPVIVHIEVWNG